VSDLQLFDALPAHIEDALRASIRRFGVLVPVIRDQQGRIIDGHHRVRIAEEEGIGIADDIVITVDSEDEAREIARTLNADRRQLTEEQRRAVVTELRREGHSERAIAGALGVSQPTVHRDLKRAEIDSGESIQPDRVIRQGGGSYPAQRPQRDETQEADLLAGDDWCEPDAPSIELPQTPQPGPSGDGREAEQGAVYARLDAELDAEMENTEARFRRNFAAAAVKAGEIATFDPNRIAEVFTGNWDRDVGDLLRTLTEWCDRVRDARRAAQRAGLRVVGAGIDE
jgi:ParB-like chromosome segregation protein Spo0J